MKPPKQDQHKIPQVYLRKFGYKDQNGQWKISVIKRGEKFTRQKSIESFTAVTNIFDIDSDDPRVPRIFEELNCDLETEYNNIIDDLEKQGNLSQKSYAYLLQIVANFIVRADYWREWILGFLEHENKENFIKGLLAPYCKDFEDFKKIEEKDFYRIIVDSPPAEAVNRVLMYFIDHLLLRLKHYEIVIVQSQEHKEWWTSTNPIVMHNRIGKNEIFAKESEVYFPLTPKFLAYLHYKDSIDKQNELRKFLTNKIYLATDAQNQGIQKSIIDNPSDYILVAGEFWYKLE